MGGFQNPIIGGMSKLIRTAIQSANFVAGLAGWSLYKNGDVEFNGGIFRGAVTVGGAANVSINSAPPALVAYYAFLASVSQVTITMAAGDGSYHYEIVGISGSGDLYYGAGIVTPAAVVVEVVNHGIGTGGGPVINWGRPPALTVAGGGGPTAVVYAEALMECAAGLQVDANGANVFGASTFHDALTAANDLWTSVSIVPVANTPTSAAITYPALAGAGTVRAQVTANSTLPGTKVVEVSASSVSATGATIWIDRTDTSSTSIWVHIHRDAT